VSGLAGISLHAHPGTHPWGATSCREAAPLTERFGACACRLVGSTISDDEDGLRCGPLVCVLPRKAPQDSLKLPHKWVAEEVVVEAAAAIDLPVGSPPLKLDASEGRHSLNVYAL
jgi:hypothetical protein